MKFITLFSLKYNSARWDHKGRLNSEAEYVVSTEKWFSSDDLAKREVFVQVWLRMRTLQSLSKAPQVFLSVLQPNRSFNSPF